MRMYIPCVHVVQKDKRCSDYLMGQPKQCAAYSNATALLPVRNVHSLLQCNAHAYCIDLFFLITLLLFCCSHRSTTIEDVPLHLCPIHALHTQR